MVVVTNPRHTSSHGDKQEKEDDNTEGQEPVGFDSLFPELVDDHQDKPGNTRNRTRAVNTAEML